MLNKVLVIGSGPIVIGQAAEFDYSGTQACKVLKEAGIHVVLVNNNPATIMTDRSVADAVYSEPLTVDFIEKIIIKEKPDALLAGMGGQTALNLSMQLSEEGLLKKYNVEMIGTNISSIETAEDRELFKKAMLEINQPSLTSYIANTVVEAKEHAHNIGYPIVVRPAYTLGGTGGGFCYDDEELKAVVTRGLSASRVSQVLIEKSIKGWKEIEYEMMRDGKGNTIVICNMENLDPVGVHTGDSIVVAPSQSLTDHEYQMLRTASIRIVEKLEIVGGCNVQLALSPDGLDYYVIEVNPRVSRSSALASKATGYPIAKVATKIALGYDLDEILNDVTKKTMASFEPTLDYCAVKIPKWPFKKFKEANRQLSTQMMATGEVMSIANNFEAALLKGIRSLENNQEGLTLEKASKMVLDELLDIVTKVDDERLYYLAELLRRGVSVVHLNAITDVDIFFLSKIQNIVKLEEALKVHKLSFISKEMMKKYKKYGFSDLQIANLVLDATKEDVRLYREQLEIQPVYKMVDTCAGEFDAESPYFYSTYDDFTENVISENEKVIVIGSGPISIGQGVEFDYCSVHGVKALQKLGYEAILINNNPETVSTDFDLADKLYFEPITVEDVMNIIDVEKPIGVILQFGGQTAIKLAETLSAYGVNILGSKYESIHLAEERESFNALMDQLEVNRPKGAAIQSMEDVMKITRQLKFPLLVRPSYVIGGEGMAILYTEKALQTHLETLPSLKDVLIDEYLEGTEIEVDCITDGDDVLIPGVMEHLEKAGVHSGDSISIYPTQTISDELLDEITRTTQVICKGLKAKGLVNVQYIYAHKMLYVIEVNPRASRTVPFLSKVTNTSMVECAVEVIMGKQLKELSYGTGRMKVKDFVAIKLPIFSMEKISNSDTMLSPVMKSTGEILSIDRTFNRAFKKSMIAIGVKEDHKSAILMVSDQKKKASIKVAEQLVLLGYKIYATKGTSMLLVEHHIPSTIVNKIGEDDNMIDLLLKMEIDMIINIPSKGYDSETDGFKIRRHAVEHHVPCYTSLETVSAKLDMMLEDISECSLELYNLCDIN